MRQLKVVYHGYVFDLSGYGEVARAYVHALHAIGINVSVVQLVKRSPQVSDSLVESLLDKPIEDVDFHLFHGTPTVWAPHASQLENAIGMTVWETDMMPPQWRDPCSKVLELWVPCEFNRTVFASALNKLVFKLPHPIFHTGSKTDPRGLNRCLNLNDNDFVFYSIIRWQDRKSPEALLEAYLRAFPHHGNCIFILKTNPGAVKIASKTLDRLRSKLGSEGRVSVRAEAWEEGDIEALHERGNCYLSLHKGEGWSYPLFEAAHRGKLVVATGYSGPMDYLRPEAHALVSYSLGPVRQPYVFYQAPMQWAYPDIPHAAQRIREVYERRVFFATRAVQAAQDINERFSLEKIGKLAYDRFVTLLRRHYPERAQRLDLHQPAATD